MTQSLYGEISKTKLIFIAGKGFIVHHLSGCTYIKIPTSELEKFLESNLLEKNFLKATESLIPNFSDCRKDGVYFFGSAKAELKTIHPITNNEIQFLKIECEKFEDLPDMARIQKMISDGEISPKISYDKKSFWRKLLAS